VTADGDPSTPRDASPVETAIQRLLDRPLSDADLAAGAEWAARPADTRDRETLGLLLFRLSNETAAIPAALLRRVTPWARPTPIPHRTTGVLRGVCNVLGELVLCADLRRLLGLPALEGADAPSRSADDPRRMVVMGAADAPWAFEVDALIGFERIAKAVIRPPPITVEYASAACTAGIADIRGEPVTVLDGERILAGFKGGLT